MTRVLCPQDRCVFWDAGVCGADEITLDPEQLSCVTMEDMDELLLDGEDLSGWEEDPDDEEWEEEEAFDEEEDDWQPY